MKKKQEKAASEMMAQIVAHGMQEKKGQAVTLLDLRKIPNALFDFFIICHAQSTTHVESIADSIEFEMHKALNEKPLHVEGYTNGEWILLDYVNIVAHVFLEDKRKFFNLEGLWADADIKQLEEDNV